MKTKLWFHTLLLGIVPFFLVSTTIFATDYPKQPITLKVEGAKMAPVTFLHETHTEKQKVACKVCHHKDNQNPKACTTCHGANEVKTGASAAKDSFHKMCRDCHVKGAAAKGVTGPTKCIECHKK
jgi:hypothetical protein